MSYRERFLAALAQEKVNRTLVAVPTNTGTIDLMHASGAFWPDAQRDAKKMAEFALAAHRIAGIESATVPFDKFVECEAYGSKLDGWSQDRQSKEIAKEARRALKRGVDILALGCNFIQAFTKVALEY